MERGLTRVIRDAARMVAVSLLFLCTSCEDSTFIAVLRDLRYPMVWIPKASMITGRGSAASAVCNDELYVITGHHTTGSSVSDYGQYNESYDPVSDAWTAHAIAPRDAYDATAAALGDFIYLFGGVDTLGWDSSNAIDRYDADINVWTPGYDTFPYTGVAGLAAVAYGDRIFLFGGYYYTYGEANENLVTVYAYDPVAAPGSRFTALASMPVVHNSFAAVLVGDKVYCIGGTGPSGSVTVNNAYDISDNAWTTGLAPIPTGRSIDAFGNIGGTVYVVCGKWRSGGAGQVAESETWAYDPGTDTWRSKTPLASPRISASSGVIGDRLYVAGGFDWTNTVDTTHCSEALEEGTPAF
jgi:N-acetylneuraminic acid mutarotase